MAIPVTYFVEGYSDRQIRLNAEDHPPVAGETVGFYDQATHRTMVWEVTYVHRTLRQQSDGTWVTDHFTVETRPAQREMFT